MSNNQRLFHPRSLSKALSANNPLKDGQIPAAARKVLDEWHAMITDGSILPQNEKELQPEFFRDLCGVVLGYKSFSQKDKKTAEWTLGYEQRSGKGFVDICFGKFSSNSSNREAKWFLVSNCLEIRLYKFPHSNYIYESWQIADLLKPDEYARFVLLLGAKNLLTGATE